MEKYIGFYNMMSFCMLHNPRKQNSRSKNGSDRDKRFGMKFDGYCVIRR